MKFYLFQKSLRLWELEKILGAAKFWRRTKLWVLGNEILGGERISGLGVGNSGRWKFCALEILGAGNILGTGNILGAGNNLGAGKILGSGKILAPTKIIVCWEKGWVVGKM